MEDATAGSSIVWLRFGRHSFTHGNNEMAGMSWTLLAAENVSPRWSGLHR